MCTINIINLMLIIPYLSYCKSLFRSLETIYTHMFQHKVARIVFPKYQFGQDVFLLHNQPFNTCGSDQDYYWKLLFSHLCLLSSPSHGFVFTSHLSLQSGHLTYFYFQIIVLLSPFQRSGNHHVLVKNGLHRKTSNFHHHCTCFVSSGPIRNRPGQIQSQVH